MTDKIKRIKELTDILNAASKAYYMEDAEIMSNFEYDRLYDELVMLEKETGTVLSNSPTVKVGYEVVSELPKEAHPAPMLSLDKTKDVEQLRSWLADKEGVLSWKMDGLTVVLTYEGGELVKAVTRGNGEIGEVITANAKTFRNIPRSISYKGSLTIRGEAVIKYSDFERINAEIPDIDAKYKNPRNLCSGSVRQLSSEITAKRNVNFFAFSMVDPDDAELAASFNDSCSKRYEFLTSLGFDVVEYRMVNAGNIAENVRYFSQKIISNDFPSDGLVLTYEDTKYGRSLGRTAKFPRDSIAFKWQDEEAVTHLREIEWSASRTGLINPVAIFDSVELEGTTVSRASVHNISIMKELSLGIGDEITVYKANMIIPQISGNNTKSGNIQIPDRCPVCGGETEIRKENASESLYCINPKCPAKHIKLFTHFVERNAMNIDGISEATLERFVDLGILKELHDIYHLSDHRDTIINLEGFGIKSYDNMMSSIEASRKVELPNFIYALGIINVGLSTAKLLVKSFGYDIDKFINADVEELSAIDQVGPTIAKSIRDYFENEENMKEIRLLRNELDIIIPDMSDALNDMEGLTFVITGSLNHYENRDELKNEIEKRGGKVAGSVSAKTSFLINNDITSSSSKNKKAKSLGIPIISEDDYLERFGK
ncbi:MAG: NAD-dependent DNA ligase LigA [Eubacterium sp.]|nr:NAD-dependent DNA ligase LigA [Eubacterium sp.]